MFSTIFVDFHFFFLHFNILFSYFLIKTSKSALRSQFWVTAKGATWKWNLRSETGRSRVKCKWSECWESVFFALFLFLAVKSNIRVSVGEHTISWSQPFHESPWGTGPETASSLLGSARKGILICRQLDCAFLLLCLSLPLPLSLFLSLAISLSLSFSSRTMISLLSIWLTMSKHCHKSANTFSLFLFFSLYVSLSLLLPLPLPKPTSLFVQLLFDLTNTPCGLHYDLWVPLVSHITSNQNCHNKLLEGCNWIDHCKHSQLMLYQIPCIKLA